jgi:transcriptional regulator with XRE-family HTH domain
MIFVNRKKIFNNKKMNGQAVKDTFGKNIKFLRFRRELSQADLAEKADISVIFLSNIERGVKFPKPEIMARLACALEIEVYELFKPPLSPETGSETLTRLCEDIHRNISLAVDNVFQRYQG